MEKRDYILSNKQYDVLKFMVQILLPALGALYFGLSQIWGFPKGEEVVGSLTLFITFLGVFLRETTKSYNDSEGKYDGAIEVEQALDKKVYSLNLNKEPEDLDNMDEVIFKVKK